MGALLILLAFVGCGLCLAGGKEGRRRFFTTVGEWLYLPIATIISLVKKCG